MVTVWLAVGLPGSGTAQEETLFDTILAMDQKLLFTSGSSATGAGPLPELSAMGTSLRLA